jgi:hypothetical protein
MQSTQSLQGKQLKELSQKKGNVVLVEKHDLEFEPWPSTRLQKCIDMIIEITHDPEQELNVDKIRKKCKEKVELMKFSNYHHTMFERLTDPEFAHNEQFMTGLRMMLDTKKRMELGDIETQEEADKEVVGKLLNNFHTKHLK